MKAISEPSLTIVATNTYNCSTRCVCPISVIVRCVQSNEKTNSPTIQRMTLSRSRVIDGTWTDPDVGKGINSAYRRLA
ncbi:hypothetical protein QFZ94_002067 [Paraburkholderia sp. JPY465]|uniref:hypothetical protein n=1 Tax=Paraburkholderia sp. JPY465 TaxID=3042285 RepID=UPI003D20D2D8